MRSLSTRLLAGTTLVLVVFVLLTGAAVSWSVHRRADAAAEQRLQGLIYGILGATDVSADGALSVREGALPEQALAAPGGGLYAEIVGNLGDRLWRSRSSIANVPEVTPTPIGEWVADTVTLDDGGSAQRLQLQSVWELEDGQELPFVVHVVDARDAAIASMRRFDRNLWAALAAVAMLLLLVQLGVLRAALGPLRKLGRDIDALSRGEREQLDEALPQELLPLAGSVNALRASERLRHARARHLLDDLAHNLRTPLTILGNLEDSRVQAQAGQMQQSIDRYLQRASAEATTALVVPRPVVAVVDRVADTMRRLHIDRDIVIDVDVSDALMLRVPEADLFEVIGNLVDNACKYGAHRVIIEGRITPATLWVSDDGPGLGGVDPEQWLARGARADTRVAGRGLGLAAVRELMQAWGGSLTLQERTPHGVCATLHFQALTGNGT